MHKSKKTPTFATQNRKRPQIADGGAKKQKGAIAQLVEQRTENPCVPGSIPGGTTQTKVKSLIHTELAISLFSPYIP